MRPPSQLLAQSYAKRRSEGMWKKSEHSNRELEIAAAACMHVESNRKTIR